MYAAQHPSGKDGVLSAGTDGVVHHRLSWFIFKVVVGVLTKYGLEFWCFVFFRYSLVRVKLRNGV